MTALPGCRKGALARLDVWTLTSTAVLAMTSNCSLKAVVALNSTTLTCTMSQAYRCTLTSGWLFEQALNLDSCRGVSEISKSLELLST